MKRNARVTAMLAAVALFATAGTALAGSWSFSWSGWRGGTRDSSTWNASRSGTHNWTKNSCRVDASGIPSGTFTVELRRVRSLAPDVSLGTQSFSCSNTNQTRSYGSGAGGAHKFRFPYVSRGDLGISGSGSVSFP